MPTFFTVDGQQSIYWLTVVQSFARIRAPSDLSVSAFSFSFILYAFLLHFTALVFVCRINFSVYGN